MMKNCKRCKYRWIFLFFAAWFLSGCQQQPKMERFELQYFDLFDTVITIIGYGESQEIFSKEALDVYEELKTCHQLFDIYHDYEGVSNLKTINDNAGIQPVKVDERIIELLVLAKEMYELTDGKVNAAYGKVLTLWHQCRTEALDDPESAKIPSKPELEDARGHADMDNVIIDQENSTVYLEDGQMSLDVGAIGKGYAAQRAAKTAKGSGMDRFLISLGGNVVSEGSRWDGSPWQLGIQNPDTESQEAYVVKVRLSGETLVTSGNYQRYYMVEGKRYHHIIDTDTGFPADYFASVSILAKDSGMADALSTAVYTMPLEEGKALVDSLEETEAFWILEDGSQVWTEGFEKYWIK